MCNPMYFFLIRQIWRGILERQADHEVGYFTLLLSFREKCRMHPLNEGILRWINKGQYFWYLISVHKHWSIGVYGKQRCFYEVTGETSCHSFSQVPQLQNAVVLMRDCSSITVFFFFTIQNEKQIAHRLSDGNTVRLLLNLRSSNSDCNSLDTPEINT